MQFFPTRVHEDDMQTFEDIVRGERVVHRVAEDESHVAFLSPNPVRPGHAIVITKRTVDSVFDLDAREFAALMEFARSLAIRLRKKLPCERVCVAAIGWQVRHAHVHLVPTQADGEFPPLSGVPLCDDELAAIAAKLEG